MDELLTVEEVAQKLRLNADSVRRLLRNKRLPGVKIGDREWRIPADALKAFIEKGTAGGEK